MNQLILASASARRAQLLQLAGLSFKVVASHVSEEFDNHILPEKVVENLAERKADAVFQQNQKINSGFILAADTIVVIENEILNKPSGYEEGAQMLKKLSGKTHKVITGVCIIHKSQKEIFSETTFVEFYPLSDSQIDYYIKKYKPFDKAGGYAIQEWIGVTGIKSIRGDYYNVMGLPVGRIIQKLQQMNFPFPFSI